MLYKCINNKQMDKIINNANDKIFLCRVLNGRKLGFLKVIENFGY